MAEAGPEGGGDEVDLAGLDGRDGPEQRGGGHLVVQGAGDVVVADRDDQPVGVDVGQPLDALLFRRVVGSHHLQADAAHQLGGVLVLAAVAERARFVELDARHPLDRLVRAALGELVETGLELGHQLLASGPPADGVADAEEQGAP